MLETDEKRHARLTLWWSTEELDLVFSLTHVELSANAYISQRVVFSYTEGSGLTESLDVGEIGI